MVDRASLVVAASLASVAASLLLLRRRRRTGTGTAGARVDSNPEAYIPLGRSALPSCPYELVTRWVAEHEAQHGFLESHAVVLATSSPEGGATARTVVLQCWSKAGLVFGSQRSSLKGRDVASDPRAEAVLRLGQRQVRFRGTMRLGDDTESDAAYRRLTRGAQLGLKVLRQGQPCDGDAAQARLVERWQALRDADDASPLSRPPDFAAFVLEPSTIEFYSGGHAGYVNDRWLYAHASDGRFEVQGRLQA